MNKILFIISLIIFINLNVIVYGYENTNICSNNNLTNNFKYMQTKDIKTNEDYNKEDNPQELNIYVKDVKVKEQSNKTNSKFNEFAVITLNIINTSLEPIELSNLDFEFYQGNVEQETFIDTENNIYGFLGVLDSGENKTVKICVTLDNKKQAIKFLLKNDQTKDGYYFKKTINLM